MADCLICDSKVAILSPTSGDRTHVQCEVCGAYEMTRTLATTFRHNSDKPLRMALAAHTRQATRLGETVILSTQNYEAIAAQHLHTPINRKLRLLLEALAETSEYPGDKVSINPHTAFPLIDAVSPAEMGYLLKALHARGDTESVNGDRWIVTTQGWERLEPAGGGAVPGTCFVAMSFDKSLDPAYDDAIRPAVVDDCGFEIVRVDRVEHVENINDKIMADLRRSQFVVADFTRHPAGVYFEAGFALGLGRLVIWTCRRDDFTEKVHFDTRPYNHILWTEPAELRGRLATRIRALLQAPKP